MPSLQLLLARHLTSTLLAESLWLIVPAVRILNDPGRHRLTHLWQRPDGSHLYSGHEVTFWARYRREFLGLP